jgi:hypothetical protein
MENPLAEMLKDLDTPNYGRLSFEEQCAYYVALMLKTPPAAVAAAAGVSQSTVSLLADAGLVRGGQVRYPRVANEYSKLGHDAFALKYLTAPIRDRLQVAYAAWKERKRNPDLNPQGFNPRADRYCRRYDWPETSIGLPAHFVIHLAPDHGGYVWRNLKPRHDLAEISLNEARVEGDPARSNRGFATSEDCFRFVRNRLNPKD